jgi:hypothetical protein
MQRALRAGAVLLATAAVLGGVAACGGSSGGGGHADATKLVSDTFGPEASKIHSGDLSLSLDLSLQGISAVPGSIGIAASGPFDVTPGQLPELDLDATVSVGGSTIPLGIISAGGSVYVSFAGTAYELPASIVGSIDRQAASANGGGSLLTSLGIDPRSWLVGAKDLGSSTVGGVSTDHVTAQVDVGRFAGDLQKILAHTSSGLSGAAASLGGADLGLLGQIVKSASVDIYTGASDHIVREFRLAAVLDVPQADQSKLGGLTGGSFTIDATITNLNAPETIKPPASSKPLSGLLSGLSGASL